MKVYLILFYNLSGFVICFLSLLMFAIHKHDGEDGIEFNTAKRYLGTIFMLTGFSMFTSQFEEQLEYGHFEKLNVLMLLFFFIIGQGFLLSFLILYASQQARKQTFKRSMLPVFILFGIYTVIFILTGDIQIYSAHELFTRLPEEPLLILRIIILISMIISILYGISLCHHARKEYNKLISNYFSETDFARSMWLSNLLGWAEALSVWVLLTYFYTTPVLEIIVGTLIIIVFSFYVKEFYEYRDRYEKFKPAILFSLQNSVVGDISIESSGPIERSYEEDKKCATLLEDWKKRTDKPFTKPGLTIGDVAKDLSIPRYRISGYINKEQKNFCSWINELRIEEAASLLIENNRLSISEIADCTGFCDLPAFSRAFKKLKKISPSEFRNKYYGYQNK